MTPCGRTPEYSFGRKRVRPARFVRSIQYTPGFSALDEVWGSRRHQLANDRKQPQDVTRVDAGDERHRRYWSARFGVREDELEGAVAAVGASPREVERFLRGPGDITQ